MILIKYKCKTNDLSFGPCVYILYLLSFPNVRFLFFTIIIIICARFSLSFSKVSVCICVYMQFSFVVVLFNSASLEYHFLRIICQHIHTRSSFSSSSFSSCLMLLVFFYLFSTSIIIKENKQTNKHPSGTDKNTLITKLIVVCDDYF